MIQLLPISRHLYKPLTSFDTIRIPGKKLQKFLNCYTFLGLGFRKQPAMSSTTNNAASSHRHPPSKPQLRKPTFIKVNQLKPGTSGHTLIAKVVTSTTVLKRGKAVSPNLRNTRIAECLIGDDTASIIFTARNDQIDIMKPGTTVIIRNAKIDMFKGTMRLAVDMWGRIEVTEPADFSVKEDNNLSLIEYELVSVVGEGQ